MLNSKKALYKLITDELEKIKDKLRELTDDALKKKIFGVPAFVVNKKMFWGQDRLSYAIDEIKK